MKKIKFVCIVSAPHLEFRIITVENIEIDIQAQCI